MRTFAFSLTPFEAVSQQSLWVTALVPMQLSGKACGGFRQLQQSLSLSRAGQTPVLCLTEQPAPASPVSCGREGHGPSVERQGNGFCRNKTTTLSQDFSPKWFYSFFSLSRSQSMKTSLQTDPWQRFPNLKIGEMMMVMVRQ